MEKYFEIISEIKLFSGIKSESYSSLFKCLGTTIKEYDKGNIIINQGENIRYIGIILEGVVELSKENISGNKSLVAMLKPKDMFGEALVCAGIENSPVTIRSMDKSKVLYIDYRKMMTMCSNNCNFHSKLISNMLKIIAQKNIRLNEKIDYLLIKGMREKIAKYLLNNCGNNPNLTFQIHLNRNELAEFLNVSRSSMSRELARMRDEKIIEYYKNSFKILDVDRLNDFV